MSNETILSKLRYHAGLTVDTDAAVPRLIDSAFDKVLFLKALADVLDSFQQLNIELNGLIPSKNIDQQSVIDRSIAYAASELITSLRKQLTLAEKIDPGLYSAIWKLELAWAAVLAGDIDDINAHIFEEEVAKN